MIALNVGAVGSVSGAVTIGSTLVDIIVSGCEVVQAIFTLCSFSRLLSGVELGACLPA